MLFNTPILSIASVLAASILGAAGQFLIAYATQRSNSGIARLVVDPYFIGGAVAYTAVLALFAVSFKSGGTVRVVYPLYATTFLWAILFGYMILHQPISTTQLFGFILLIAGVVCMTA